MVEDHYRKDAYLARLIRRKAKALCQSSGFQSHEQRDLEQDLWLHLQERSSRYEPARRVTFETFADRVIRNQVTSIARHRKAAKRNPEREEMSLNQMVGDGDDGQIEVNQTIADPRAPRPDANDLKHDLITVTRLLTRRQQSIVRRLRLGESRTRIARRMGISLEQVRMEIDAIRACFRRHGLDAYLGESRFDLDGDGVDHE